MAWHGVDFEHENAEEDDQFDEFDVFFFEMIHADTCRNDAFTSKSYKEFMLCIIYLNVVRCDSQTPLHSDTQVRIGFPIACTRATAAQAVPLYV